VTRDSPGELAEATDCDLKFTCSGESPWSTDSGSDSEYYLDGDSARSGSPSDSGGESCMQTIVDIDSSETLKFHWKVSSESNGDYLEFYIDDTRQDRISGEVDWTQKTYTVSAGIHTLKWRYVKDGSGYDGDDCGWVDFVQWSGESPAQDTSNWQTITYKHDVYGRRVEKKVDGYSTRYVHDGGHVIAEYDGNNNLFRKYIYGPGIDEPVCMIEVADSNAAYYYHFDALGSVVALSDSSGDTVQTYEYSVYGQVAVEDANHPNPYMFAGRRYDIEIGLYYNRARYYNPYIGRLLQTDPVGYADGINWYLYCKNNPVNFVDPSGKWWGEDHWQLTYDAMKACGYNTMEAGLTAYADQNVDYWTTTAQAEHHFKGTEAAGESIIRDELFAAVTAARAEDASMAEAFEHLGRALHTVQDRYSHSVQGVSRSNHYLHGRDPDNPEEHDKEYNDAINNTVSVIELFKRLVSGEPEDVDEFFDAYDQWIDDYEQALEEERERREDE